MLKAIFAKHIQAGYRVMLSGGRTLITVASVETVDSHVRLYLGEKDGWFITLREYDIVGLGHKPWPLGKTEQNMSDAAYAAIHVRAPLSRIREAIEEYELGKSDATDADGDGAIHGKLYCGDGHEFRH